MYIKCMQMCCLCPEEFRTVFAFLLNFKRPLLWDCLKVWHDSTNFRVLQKTTVEKKQ